MSMHLGLPRLDAYRSRTCASGRLIGVRQTSYDIMAFIDRGADHPTFSISIAGREVFAGGAQAQALTSSATGTPTAAHWPGGRGFGSVSL